jgi:hypothetical protein
MKWVTRNYLHLDRMACVWLIHRFIDPHAEFEYVPWGQEHTRDTNAIAFSIPGTSFPPHDHVGTTFKKLIVHYSLSDPVLIELDSIIQKGVNHVLHQYQPDASDIHGQMAIGLLAISEGFMLTITDDFKIVQANSPIYDALYDYLKVHQIVHSNGLSIPKDHQLGPTVPTNYLRDLLQNES